jgi:hypothetical protein
VRTDIIQTRVDRTLHVRKMKDSTLMDHLIKVTVDEAGVQVDTRGVRRLRTTKELPPSSQGRGNSAVCKYI